MTEASKQNLESGFLSKYGRLLLIAMLLSFFLFFIDEGYYDLRWMNNSQNWLIFIIFVAGLFFGPAIVSEFMFKNSIGFKKKMAVFGIGLPLGVICVYLSLFGFALLRGIAVFFFSTI